MKGHISIACFSISTNAAPMGSHSRLYLENHSSFGLLTKTYAYVSSHLITENGIAYAERDLNILCPSIAIDSHTFHGGH